MTTKCLDTVPGKHSVDSVQETAVLGASHIVRKVLQSETCLIGWSAPLVEGEKLKGKGSL
jgi:hypothetical protein